MEYNHRIAELILAQGDVKVLCVKSGKSEGILVGDRCIVRQGYYVPLVRWMSEGLGEQQPMNPIKCEDANDFEFVPL
jgi:hypothetical protein